jgi:hypothetical protein
VEGWLVTLFDHPHTDLDLFPHHFLPAPQRVSLHSNVSSYFHITSTTTIAVPSIVIVIVNLINRVTCIT